MAVICFDLIPESLEISNIIEVLIGTILGIIAMIFCDLLVDKKFSTKIQTNNKQSKLLKTGMIVSIGLAIHNFPEGLAIRVWF